MIHDYEPGMDEDPVRDDYDAWRAERDADRNEDCMTSNDDDIPPALKTFTTDRLRQLMVDAATLAGSATVGELAAGVYRRLARQCDALITKREQK